MILERSAVRFGGNKNFTMKGEVTLHTSGHGQPFFENEVTLLRYPGGACCVQISFRDQAGAYQASLSSELRELVGEGEDLELVKLPQVPIRRVRKALVDHLKEDRVEISANLLDQLERKEGDRLFLINSFNGYRLDLSREAILVNRQEEDIFRLTLKQRRLLDLELPTYIARPYLEELGEGLGDYYADESQNVVYDDYYRAAADFRRACQGREHSPLVLYCAPPLPDGPRSLPHRLKAGLERGWNRFLAPLIGQRQMALRAVRPAPVDESENIVRMSGLAMKLLGLEETDGLVLRHGTTSMKAKVMEIESFTSLAGENRLKSEQELDLVIGIPAHLRASLGLTYINTVVGVERDLTYLFKKSMNNQMLTLIGFLISVSFINQALTSLGAKILSYGLIVLVLLYLSFSEIREKIS